MPESLLQENANDLGWGSNAITIYYYSHPHAKEKWKIAFAGK